MARSSQRRDRAGLRRRTSAAAWASEAGGSVVPEIGPAVSLPRYFPEIVVPYPALDRPYWRPPKHIHAAVTLANDASGSFDVVQAVALPAIITPRSRLEIEKRPHAAQPGAALAPRSDARAMRCAAHMNTYIKGQPRPSGTGGLCAEPALSCIEVPKSDDLAGRGQFPDLIPGRPEHLASHLR